MRYLINLLLLGVLVLGVNAAETKTDLDTGTKGRNIYWDNTNKRFLIGWEGSFGNVLARRIHVYDSGPATWNHSSVVSSAIFDLGGYQLTEHVGQNSVGYTQALVGSILIPSTSTTAGHGAGVSGYAKTLSANFGGGAVGVFGLGVLGAVTGVWGSNFSCNAYSNYKINQIVDSGSTATATSDTAHNISNGKTVYVSGVTGAGVGLNGFVTVTSVPTTTTFTFTSSGVTDGTFNNTGITVGDQFAGNCWGVEVNLNALPSPAVQPANMWAIAISNASYRAPSGEYIGFKSQRALSSHAQFTNFIKSFDGNADNGLYLGAIHETDASSRSQTIKLKARTAASAEKEATIYLNAFNYLTTLAGGYDFQNEVGSSYLTLDATSARFGIAAYITATAATANSASYRLSWNARDSGNNSKEAHMFLNASNYLVGLAGGYSLQNEVGSAYLDIDSTSIRPGVNINLPGGSEPTCNSAARGTIVHVEGGAGVADTVRICTKDAADAYGWRTLI